MADAEVLEIGWNESRLIVQFRHGQQTEWANRLKVDFFHFKTDWRVKKKYLIDVVEDLPQPTWELRAFSFNCKNWRWRCAGPGRRIDYEDGSRTLLHSSSDGVHILFATGGHPQAYETLYKLCLSLLGEQLEHAGYVRLHAMGFVNDHGANLVWGQSGAGKSTLTQTLLAQFDQDVYGDEIVLYKNSLCTSFPLGISYAASGRVGKNRRLLPKDRLAKPRPLNRMYVLTPQRMVENRLDRLGLGRSLGITLLIVVGWHLPQLAEVALRKDNLVPLIRTAWQRFRFAAKVLREKKIVGLKLRDRAFGVDQNARGLVEGSLPINKPCSRWRKGRFAGFAH